MEWYTILAVVLLIILTILLGIVIACTLAGQRCTISIQQRTQNHELTKIREENELKKQKKFSSKLKRAFRSSSEPEKPMLPVDDVKTFEFTLKLGDEEKKDEQTMTSNEPLVVLPPKVYGTQAERDEREKRREALRRKYNL